MKIEDLQEVESSASNTSKLVNNMMGKSIELLDLAYPNHEGKQDAKAVGEIMCLRQTLNSLSKACDMLVEKLTGSISDELERLIIKTGFRYLANEDGTYDVCYDHSQDSYFSPIMKHHVATIKDVKNAWYINNNMGLGEVEYPKDEWTLAEAIKDNVTRFLPYG